MKSLVLRAARRLMGSPRPAPIWLGVYDSFESVPSSGPSFAGEVWTRNMVEGARVTRAMLNEDRLSAPADRGAFIAAIAILAAERAGRRVSILDVGGGLGIEFLHLAAGAPGVSTDYHIVETESICAEGERLFAGEVRFHHDIPANVHFDVVHCSGVLQFVDDYRGFLSRLAGLGPDFLSLGAVPMGASRTYASAQVNVAGSVIPAWFFTESAVESVLRETGYECILRLEHARVFPQDNFPPELRVRLRSLILRRPIA